MGDQAAIHEAMEQQTITITKAGIQATLNARASILAACNPVWGRYDTSKPMRYNINMSAPIMSRFDLFFVVLDECDEVTDYHVAKHILGTHQKQTGDSSMDVDDSEANADRFTVRQLESLIRLSEGLARLHCDNVVSPKYVKEAARLLKKSIISVDSEDVALFDPMDDEKEEQKGGVDDEKKDGGDGGADADGGDGGGQQQLTINYNAYMRTANLIVHMIRRTETEPEAGIKQSKIENLVMKEKHDELESEEDIERENKLLKFVIHRLIEVDHILLIKEDNTEDVVERVIIVHPNYDPDSRNTDNLGIGNEETQHEQKKRKKKVQGSPNKMMKQ